MSVISWFAKSPNLLWEYKTESFRPVTGFSVVSKVPITALWTLLLTLNNSFLSFTPLNVISSSTAKNYKWVPPLKDKSLMMCLSPNVRITPKIFYLKWGPPLSLITCLPPYPNGLILSLVINKMEHKLSLLITSSTSLPIKKTLLFKKQCLKWKRLPLKYKFQNSAKPLSRYLKKNTLSKEPEFLTWTWHRMFKTKKC